jgi:methionyl aminopeptidase
LDRFSRDFVEKRGANPAFLGHLDYPASLCASVNNEVIHGIPGKRKLKKGDIIGLDFGVNYKGYISDAAITLPVSQVSELAQRLMRRTEEALSLAIEATREGGRIRDISTAVYNHARSAGFDVVREFCGHGVGFEVHESPQIPNYIGKGPNPRLKQGMVLAIEPMINAGGSDIAILDDEWTVVTADGSLSAHFEHTLAITEEGVEILTADGAAP